MSGRQKRWNWRNLRSPWERIIYAAEQGTGCRLSHDDCYHLSMDDAIATRADLDESYRKGENEGWDD